MSAHLSQVGARRLGWKWVLLACGRTLFQEVARRWEAGEIQYDAAHWGARLTDEQLADHRTFAETAVQRRGAVEAACLLQRARNGLGKDEIILFYAGRLEFLVYLCNLAEFKGYAMALGSLDMVWRRALAIEEVNGFTQAFYKEKTTDCLAKLQVALEGG